MFAEGEILDHTFPGKHPLQLGPASKESFYFHVGGQEQYAFLPTLHVLPPKEEQGGSHEDLQLKLFLYSRRGLQATGGIATHHWPSGHILARFLSINRDLVKGKRIIELGAGLAIPSIIAASSGASVNITDIHGAAMTKTKQVLKLNSEAMNFKLCERADFPLQPSEPPSVCVSYLNWEFLTVVDEAVYDPNESDVEVGNYDIVLGSDIIHENEHAPLVANAIDKLLSDTGVAFIVNTGPFSRYGIDMFPKELEDRNLRFTYCDVPAWIKYDLEDEFLHHQIFVITKHNKALYQ